MHFQLVRYFTIAGLGMFLLVAAALIVFERQQGEFFEQVQGQQNQFFKQVQAAFAKQQDESARRDLLAIQEAGNINLARLFANALWERDFAPFVAKAQKLEAAQCHALPDAKDKDGKITPSDEKKACFAEVGAKIRAFPEFKALDAKVFDAMKKSTVFKIKVYDLRGITVYSSDHSQIGEDKSSNTGWKSAIEGKPASKVSHRDKFGAFEGVVHNRDLLESYIPVTAPDSDKIVGSFEVYSDVTQFLEQIKKTSGQIANVAAENQAKLEKAALNNQTQVESASNRSIALVLGLMALLFGSLFALVRRADHIIAEQSKQREQAQQQLAQAEKMASLGQMVAGVAHQLNTPLAFSHNNVTMAMDALRHFDLPLRVATAFKKLVTVAEGDKVTLNVAKVKSQVADFDESALDVAMLSDMLGDTLQGIDQMRELVENLRDFTRLDRNKVTEFDLNKGLHNVAYIARSVIPTRVQIVEEYGALPMLMCNPSQLNQVFLNLINNGAQAIAQEGTITIRSCVDGERIRVDVTDTGSGISAGSLPHIFENYYTTKPVGEGTGLGLPIAQSIVVEHGGEITVCTEEGKGTTFTVYLPVAEQLRKAA